MVKQCFGPNRDARNTVEAHRRVADDDSYDHGRDHRDERRPRQRDDRRRDGHYDSDDDRGHNWLPNQRGPRAFGQWVHDVQFPPRFWAPTNVPRYDRETNPSVWLEDYRLACHAGGVTDEVTKICTTLIESKAPIRRVVISNSNYLCYSSSTSIQI